MSPLSYIWSFASNDPLIFLTVLLMTASVLMILLYCYLLFLLLLEGCTEPPENNLPRRKHSPTHLLVVLGSGGHTTEMLSMLRRIRLEEELYTHRTYVVSSGDSFSAQKAVEFEESLPLRSSLQDRDERSTYGGDATADTEPKTAENNANPAEKPYDIVTVPRARRVHQSLLTAPFSALHCFWVCLRVLRGKLPGQRAHPIYPDLILTNGPATAVCVILAAKLLLLRNCLFYPRPRRQAGENDPIEVQDPTAAFRVIFIESWARVTSLSLSGKIVLPIVDKFLVQWELLDGKTGWDGNMLFGRRRRPKQTEFVGTLVG